MCIIFPSVLSNCLNDLLEFFANVCATCALRGRFGFGLWTPRYFLKVVDLNESLQYYTYYWMGYLWDQCAVNISEDQFTVRTWVRKVWERFRRCTKHCKTNAPPPQKKKTLTSKCITSYDCAWPELFFCVCVRVCHRRRCFWRFLANFAHRNGIRNLTTSSYMLKAWRWWSVANTAKR